MGFFFKGLTQHTPDELRLRTQSGPVCDMIRKSLSNLLWVALFTLTAHHHTSALEGVGVSLTGAVAYGHGFALSAVPVKCRQRDLVLIILLDPLKDGPFTLTAHPQLK